MLGRFLAHHSHRYSVWSCVVDKAFEKTDCVLDCTTHQMLQQLSSLSTQLIV